MRPWYVLGPGHWWPYLLVPVYLPAKVIPSTRESAQGLGLVTIRQMIQSLVWAIEHPAEGTLAVAVEDIKHRRREIGFSS